MISVNICVHKNVRVVYASEEDSYRPSNLVQKDCSRALSNLGMILETQAVCSAEDLHHAVNNPGTTSLEYGPLCLVSTGSDVGCRHVFAFNYI